MVSTAKTVTLLVIITMRARDGYSSGCGSPAWTEKSRQRQGQTYLREVSRSTKFAQSMEAFIMSQSESGFGQFDSCSSPPFGKHITKADSLPHCSCDGDQHRVKYERSCPVDKCSHSNPFAAEFASAAAPERRRTSGLHSHPSFSAPAPRQGTSSPAFDDPSSP